MTETPVPRYAEAFISYGAHNNTKLYTEYGFTIPDNPHDFFPVNLKDIREFLSQQHPATSFWEEKANILTTISHLADNLGITVDEGLSWSLKAALKVFLMDATELNSWSSVYQVESFDHNYLTDFTRFLLKQLKRSLVKMQAIVRPSKDFPLAIDLVAGHVGLLEKTLADLSGS